MSELTARQAEILQLIHRAVAVTGMPPTRAEIAKTLGFRSPNAAEQHLKALARKGVLELLPGTSRGIRLRQPSHAPETAAGLPVVGRVAAGQPILAQEHIENYYPLPPELFHPQADYLLRVQGLSMRDVGILDGDLLAVHRTTEARNRQIVVARVGDEVTVKRFYRRGHEVRLFPENPDYQPIVLDLREQSLEIEGLGVGVIRHFGASEGSRLKASKKPV